MCWGVGCYRPVGKIYLSTVVLWWVLSCSLWFQDFATLDVEDIMAKQVEQLEKEKKELMDRLKNQEKKVRH